jgi:tRNA/tmRNA/rRNA uracil-C5-methylase (TrmA/RlmC/RlmD family)
LPAHISGRIQCSFPRKLLKDFIDCYIIMQCRRYFSEPGDVVVDMLCGSGSATVAAACLRRDVLAVDYKDSMVRCTYSFIH